MILQCSKWYRSELDIPIFELRLLLIAFTVHLIISCDVLSNKFNLKTILLIFVKFSFVKIRADGHTIPDLLTAVCKLVPLDTYVYAPVILMDLVNMDKNQGMEKPPVWEVYQSMLENIKHRI